LFDQEQNLHVTIGGRLVSACCFRTLSSGAQSALQLDGERCEMTTVLIVLLVLFLLGGGGWGYSRWRG
jgi:hypothetical protein